MLNTSETCWDNQVIPLSSAVYADCVGAPTYYCGASPAGAHCRWDQVGSQNISVQGGTHLS